MNMRAAAVSGLVTGALVLFVAWLFEWPLDRVALLAPVVVVVFGAVAGLALLWSRAALESLRRSRHPRRLVAIGVAALALLVVLSVLGVELPRD